MLSSRLTFLAAGACRSTVRQSTRQFGVSSCQRAMFNVQDDEDFKKRVLKSSTPVIVDFHAAWCGPCKILGPRLEKLIENEFKNKVDFAKVDIDTLFDLATEYNVQSVPMVIAIKNGKEVGKFIGLVEEDKLRAFINNALNK